MSAATTPTETPVCLGPLVSFKTKAGEVPALENGDQLTAPEFRRRYEAMPHLKKAELINGVVHIMPWPVSYQRHASPHADLITWLGFFRANTPGVGVGDNTTLRLDLDNEPQPDASLLLLPEYGGRARFEDDGFIAEGPELVAEVSNTSVSIDLHAKLHVYRRAGIPEYLVWRVGDAAIDWFTLVGGHYQPAPVGKDGVVKSGVFPGLWLDAAALLAGDMQRVLAVAQQGVASDEHKAFAATLANKRRAFLSEGE